MVYQVPVFHLFFLAPVCGFTAGRLDLIDYNYTVRMLLYLSLIHI